jgi:hypothetical protein
MRQRWVLLTAGLALLAPVVAAGFAFAASPRSETTVATQATAKFHSLAAAQAAGYTVVVQDAAGITCISQPGAGTMGIHYLNPALVDATIEATKPEMVVYEPRPNGKLKLVTLEYFVLQSAWDATHSSPPSLFGQQFMLTPSSNRYGLPPFYALHAWIWSPNPSGLFAPYNPRVSCG